METPKINVDKINVILATDCGSTTSKARFFKKIGNEYRFIVAGEAPTTVEAPYEDVTVGVRNAIIEVEELIGHKILDKEGIIMPYQGGDVGVDLYVTTSSAGGGLQMMVSGVIKSMTAESAERASLGAGAIVMDVSAIDDGRRVFEKIRRMRSLRPDMILVAGGTDGGTISHVIESIELIKMSEPKPRFGAGFQIPIVYAGNKDAREHVAKLLGEKFAVKFVDNIRPLLEVENPDPARNAIHEFFMEHVMSHAPGYDKLMRWTRVPIMPTPAGEGKMFRMMAEMYNANVIGVGLGGATTNIYSTYDGKFVRTVSANLGMSYSICNVLKEAGIGNIMRWIPFDIDEIDLLDSLHNKMIRPTSIPATLEALLIEHAVARESLRLAFSHHKFLARPLLGTRAKTVEASLYIPGMAKRAFEQTYIDMMRIDWLAGTGGLLSHAPRKTQSAIMLIDGFQPVGVTRLAQDSIFMMPHLGVLSTVHPKAAMEIFDKDCLVRLGVCIAPKGQFESGERREILRVNVKTSNGITFEEKIMSGSIKRIPLREGEKAQVKIKPASKFDVGAGSGRLLTTTVEGGVVGIIIDARGRPLFLPEKDNERRKILLEWFKAVDAYPKKLFGICGSEK